MEKNAEISCNRKEKNKYPLEGNCLIKSIVYMATVETETNSSSYIGMTGSSFITRYYNHIKSFKNKRYENVSSVVSVNAFSMLLVNPCQSAFL